MTESTPPTDANTDRVVGPLREWRRPLHEDLHQLQRAANAVTAEPRVALAALDAALDFLRDRFLKICQAEEFTMFIAVDGVMGVVGGTRVMAAQHGSIRAMVGDLAQVVEAARADGDVAAYSRYLLPLLYGLYALSRAHLEAEDDVYLAVLDSAVSESQVGMIVDNLVRISQAVAPGAGT
jgi:hemerythrin-like domain-containing protein